MILVLTKGHKFGSCPVFRPTHLALSAEPPSKAAAVAMTFGDFLWQGSLKSCPKWKSQWLRWWMFTVFRQNTCVYILPWICSCHLWTSTRQDCWHVVPSVLFRMFRKKRGITLYKWFVIQDCMENTCFLCAWHAGYIHVLTIPHPNTVTWRFTL